MCPYETWQRGYFTFCELQRCSWIREPLNTLSNTGFLIVGGWVLYRYRRVPQVRVIGAAAVFVGVLSSFYHATSSLIGENADLGSMFLLVGGLIAFNLQRLKFISVRASEWLAVFLAAVGFILVMGLPGSGKPIFEGMVNLTLLLELTNFIIARRHGPLTYSYRFLLLGLGCHLTAFVFWTLDRNRTLCFPDSLLFQGHALWHVLEAFTFICLTKFYLQFRRSV